MKKIGIFYGSTTGSTDNIAHRLGKMLGVDEADIHNVAETAPSEVGNYSNLVFGTSTWGSGDLQEDWYDFLNGIESLDLKGKKLALFGLGDESFSDTFCSAVGEIHDRMAGTGVEFIGAYDTGGYTFDSSNAVNDEGLAVGLLLDEVNHPELTDFRLRDWVGEVADVLA